MLLLVILDTLNEELNARKDGSGKDCKKRRKSLGQFFPAPPPPQFIRSPYSDHFSPTELLYLPDLMQEV